MIRPARETDIPYIEAIAKQSVNVMKEEKNDQWDETYPLAEHFIKDIENGSIFVKELSGEVVGSITIDQDFSSAYEGFTWTFPFEQSMIFHRLAVNPSLRKEGVASLLIQFAEDYARDKGMIAIKVDTYSLNKKAQALFTKRGYSYIGEATLPERKNPFYFYEKPLT